MEGKKKKYREINWEKLNKSMVVFLKASGQGLGKALITIQLSEKASSLPKDLNWVWTANKIQTKIKIETVIDKKACECIWSTITQNMHMRMDKKQELLLWEIASIEMI